MNRVCVFFISILLILSISTSAQEQIPLSTDHPQYLWRTNPHRYPIQDAHIFPQVTFTSGSSLNNLGKAWVAWTFNVSEGLLGQFGTYHQGKLSNVNTLSEYYQEIVWFGVQESLVIIGVRQNITDIHFVLDTDRTITRTIVGATQDHEIYVDQDKILVYAFNAALNHSVYYARQGLSIVETSTQETVSDANIRGAVINRNDSRIFMTSQGNFTLPNSLSDNLKVGHIQLVPVIYDITNQFIWLPGGITVDFPENIHRISYYGLQSSILYGNHSIFEFSGDGWNEVSTFDNLPLDMAIIDIGLYIGPISYNGLGVVMAGDDEDQDGVPDTMEDYFGSLPTSVDTDSDGMTDYDEITTGLDPIVANQNDDADNDGLSNIKEIELSLDPLNHDSDYGGALDGWEIQYGYDPMNPSDDTLDEDDDGATNAAESLWGSNPMSSDTDGDQMPDGWEISGGIDPTIANADDDPDGDGRSNIQEYRDATDPLIANPRPLFDGFYIEIGIMLLVMTPVSYFIWRKLVSDMN